MKRVPKLIAAAVAEAEAGTTIPAMRASLANLAGKKPRSAASFESKSCCADFQFHS
jgi:hypothetical protein